MPDRLRKLLAGLVLALASLFLTLLLLELAVRALGLAPPADSPGWFWRVPDAETGWSLQPGARGRWFNPRYEYDVDVAINAQGLRDVARDGYDKPAGLFRILLLGDSYVEGLRVPLEDTFGKVLEAQLNGAAGSRPVEVVSAGVSGWGTDQELLWYRSEGRRYDADLVLLAFFPGNDFQNNSEALESANMGGVRKPFFELREGELLLRHHPFGEEAEGADRELGEGKLGSGEGADRELGDGKLGSGDGESADGEAVSGEGMAGVRRWLHEHSALYRWAAPIAGDSVPWLARLGLVEAGQAAAAARLGPEYVPIAYGVYRQPPEPAWQESFALTGALIAELAAEVEADGARLAVVALTGPEQVYAERWQALPDRYPAMQAHPYDPEQPNRALRAMVEGAGLPYLDLLPLFRDQTNGPPLHLAHDGHWTPAGERLAGESIAAFLVQAGLATQWSAGSIPGSSQER